jgi:serine/threonine protein phosphatase 1
MSIYSRYKKALSNRTGGTSETDAPPFIRNKIARHEANTHGRDFIVGDLHGCVGYLDTLMRHVGFNESTDRLFSVGDLVDRGPNSVGAIGLLEMPWFYPVMGNHDAMLMAVLMEYLGAASGSGDLSDVDRARAEIYGSEFFGNGGEWLKPFLRNATQVDTLTEWLMLLRKMPLIRVVGSVAGICRPQGCRPQDRFHVAHAELLGGDADWCDLTLDQPDAEENPLWNNPHDIWGFDMTGDGVDHVMWGRELRARVAENDVPDQQDLSRTYVGHTITVTQDKSQLLTAGSHVFLDTGAYKSVPNDKGVCDLNHGLTIWCHQEDRGWKYNGLTIRDVRVVY